MWCEYERGVGLAIELERVNRKSFWIIGIINKKKYDNKETEFGLFEKNK